MKKNYILGTLLLFIFALNVNAQNVLYEQITDIGATSGIISDYITNDALGTYAAEDFVLTSESGIETVFIPGFQNNADISTVGTSIDLLIYADNGGVPASDPNTANSGVYELRGLPMGDAAISVTDNDFTIDLVAANGSAIILPAGTYWLVFVVHVPTLDDRWNWFQGGAADVQNAQLLDDGNFGTPFPWTSFTNLGLSFGSLAFRIEGSATATVSDYTNIEIQINNPVENELYINTSAKIENLSIYSISGKAIYSGTFNEKLDISKFTDGIYFLNIQTNKGTFVKKIIKK